MKVPYSKVEWRGQEYHATEGTNILMRVIRDPAIDAAARAEALDRLARLRNQSVTAELVELYPTFESWKEKCGVIQCLMWSEDPRALPLLTESLELEQDDKVRLFAAMGLAQWNARQGVKALVDLLDSECLYEQPAYRLSVRENALEIFANYNRRKGWGYSEDEARQRISSSTDLGDLDEAEKWVLAVADIKRWFSANKNRFPEWKPGDPLPEVEELSDPEAKEKPDE